MTALARGIGLRLIQVFGLLLAVVVLNFILIQLAPGDAALVLASQTGSGDPEYLARLRAGYGLDRPLVVQLLTYIWNVVQLDLGESFFYERPVLDVIMGRMWPTLLLAGSALTHALPVFWTGIMLIILFASKFQILPVSGMEDLRYKGGWFGERLDNLEHLVLPAVTLAIIYLAYYSRLARASMLEVLESDYIRTARAKGASERTVVYKHALRNALIPIVTFAGLQFGALFSGAVLVETVFNWPGLGRMAFESILRRDTPLMLGLLLVSAAMVIVANLLTDLVYRLIDPRIRVGGSR